MKREMIHHLAIVLADTVTGEHTAIHERTGN